MSDKKMVKKVLDFQAKMDRMMAEKQKSKVARLRDILQAEELEKLKKKLEDE